MMNPGGDEPASWAGGQPKVYAIQNRRFLPGEGQPKITSGRPQTSASTRGDTGPDAMQTQRANRAALFIKTMNTIHEERVHEKSHLAMFLIFLNQANLVVWCIVEQL